LPERSESARHLADLKASARHGATLVRQMLAFGRQGILRPMGIDLRPVVERSLGMLRRMLPATIRIPDVEGGPAWGIADEASVTQVLLNLATNARDAMPHGGELRLAVKEVIRRDQVRGDERRYSTISVTDTGTGMAPETVRRAFEPFFTTKAAGQGTGLGLAMVHGVMEQQGGWIEISSTPGTGTTMTLGFPAAAADQAEGRSTPPTLTPTRIQGTILLVEDDPALRRVTQRTLELAGATVVAASDGEQAWEAWLARGDGIDVVVTDAVMPECTGPELIRRLQAAGARCPVVLMSGYTAEDLADVGRSVVQVAKPWTLPELAGAISRARGRVAA
jgi:CheY-like chemotaxis protein